MIDFHAALKRIPLEAWITCERERGKETEKREEIEKQSERENKRDNEEQDTLPYSSFQRAFPPPPFTTLIYLHLVFLIFLF